MFLIVLVLNIENHMKGTGNEFKDTRKSPRIRKLNYFVNAYYKPVKKEAKCNFQHFRNKNVKNI